MYSSPSLFLDLFHHEGCIPFMRACSLTAGLKSKPMRPSWQWRPMFRIWCIPSMITFFNKLKYGKRINAAGNFTPVCLIDSSRISFSNAAVSHVDIDSCLLAARRMNSSVFKSDGPAVREYVRNMSKICNKHVLGVFVTSFL